MTGTFPPPLAKPNVVSLSERFEQALVFAARLHRNQVRKLSGGPYFGHLLAVAAIVLEHGGSEDEAIAALLHDSVEDQGGAVTREEIRRRFGDRIVEIIDGCTDTDVSPKPPWKERKLAHLAHVRRAGPSIRLVLAADKLHNLRSLHQNYRQVGEALWRHFQGGKEGTLWYYRAMLDALRAEHTSALLDEYEQALRNLEVLIASPTCRSDAPNT